ncbi:spore germination protein [Bengtsoniella intestinalis]|uniref:spore germination protein n=1 Tax=Bengtsoniella intestinalis TaxID=3073143 RepID=UPI00391FC603
MEQITKYYQQNVDYFNTTLGVGRSCDVVSRDLHIAGRKARIWLIDGYGKDDVIERMSAFWLTIPQANVEKVADMKTFVERFVTFSEVDVSKTTQEIVTGVLLGKTLLLVEGVYGAATIDAKDYPSRGVGEPSDGKVLRGSHDGFVEAMVPNMALLRRRIRDPHLTMESMQVGSRSHSDLVLCYLDDKVDTKILADLRTKLQSIEAQSLSMGQESVAESIRHKQWYNPFPKIRYTERPDTAAACVMEGRIVLMVDNSPSVMLLPTSFFDFVQEANDFYFPPLVGSYLRLLRMAVFAISLFITPVWYLLVKEAGRLPVYLAFLAEPEATTLGLFWQLMIVEFLVDVLKLASLNTPDALNGSFAMLGTLILGDFAVQAEWLSVEVLVYMAFVSVASFAQPSFEMGYAFKLLRLVMLALIAVADVWGFAAGLTVIAVLLATNRPIVGQGYLYPLIPFDKKAMGRLLVRRPISKDNT